MLLACGCRVKFDMDGNIQFVETCNPHKSDQEFLSGGGLASLIGKRVRLVDNKPGEFWLYSGKEGTFKGRDPDFPMDVMVLLDNGLVVYAGPDDITEVPVN